MTAQAMEDITVNPRSVRLLHLHIKKTGGQTINNILERSYRLSRLYALVQASYSLEEMETLLWFYRHMCFASHSFRLVSMPFDHPIRVISMVRNPVDQILSAYFFSRDSGHVSPHHPVKKMKLAEIAAALHAGSFNTQNLFESQLYQLTGVEDQEEALQLVRTCLDNDKTFVFVNERYDESLLLLTALFRGKLNFKMGVRKNVSKKDQKVTDEIRGTLSRLPWVEGDRRLHAIANEFMDRLIVRLFGSRKAFDEKLVVFRRAQAPKRPKQDTLPTPTPPISPPPVKRAKPTRKSLQNVLGGWSKGKK